MKAITLRQPWATLMALGVKRNETRSWRTSHRGPLAIHAGKHLNGRVGDVIEFRSDPYEVAIIATRVRDGIELSRGGQPTLLLPLGAVVAIVSVVDVKRTDSNELHPDTLERAMGDYSPGRFAWQTGSLFVPAVPIPAVGKQGLWEWTAPPALLYYGRLLP